MDSRLGHGSSTVLIPFKFEGIIGSDAVGDPAMLDKVTVTIEETMRKMAFIGTGGSRFLPNK